jgi:hypothetical protein
LEQLVYAGYNLGMKTEEQGVGMMGRVVEI